MSAGHTPGPWGIVQPYLSEVQTTDNQTVASCWYGGAEGVQITVTGVLRCSPEESSANARLIAAAPELLEALREVRESDADWRVLTLEQRERIAAAIAKATGAAK